MLNEHTISLIKYYKSKPGGDLLTNDDLLLLVNDFENKTYYEGDVFSCNSKPAGEFGFVYSGVFKCVSATTSKVTDLIFPEYNNVLFDWEHYLLGTVPTFSIVATTKSVVLSISKEKFNALCGKMPFFNSVSKCMIHHSAKAKNQLMMDYKPLKCEQRKLKFINDYEEAAKRLTNYELCEFLNVNKNTK